MIVPLGDSASVKSFTDKFPYIISPLFPNELFFRGPKRRDCKSQVLDIENAFVYLRNDPEWKRVLESEVRLYSWSQNHPLSDLFLIQLGRYPSPEDVGVDYTKMLMEIAGIATSIELSESAAMPPEILDHPTISSISKYLLKRKREARGWESPGFFIGDVQNISDLICHWNLRAANIPLLFVDLNFLELYSLIIPEWETRETASSDVRI